MYISISLSLYLYISISIYIYIYIYILCSEAVRVARAVARQPANYSIVVHCLVYHYAISYFNIV